MTTQVPILRFGAAVESASCAFILLHGREGSADDMQRLAARIDLPGVHYFVPEAQGKTWYPGRFTAPLAENEPWLSQSLTLCESLVQEALRAGFPLGRIAIGGFSQGACLISEFLVRHPRRYGAAFVFTGGLIGPPGTTWPRPRALAGLPVYMSSSEMDEWIPLDRYRESVEVLSECGALVESRLFKYRAHLVCDEEIASAKEMLFRLTQKQP